MKLVVSYGGGTNSTALLIGLFERKITPDLILFADTGSEKPETYRHLEKVQSWCDIVGFPEIVIVKNELPQGKIDGSLHAECFRLGTMPSKTFGFSTCSMKWKVEPQRKYQKAWMAANGIAHVDHAIGYDAGEINRSLKSKVVADYETLRYFLIEWGWAREECVNAIARYGIPQPGKSACFMCPSSKKPEVLWLKENHPNLYEKAIDLESRAIVGVGPAPAARVEGLGRHWNWATFAGSDAATPAYCINCHDGDAES